MAAKKKGKAQKAMLGVKGLAGMNTASFDPASTLIRPQMRVLSLALFWIVDEAANTRTRQHTILFIRIQFFNLRIGCLSVQSEKVSSNEQGEKVG